MNIKCYVYKKLSNFKLFLAFKKSFYLSALFISILSIFKFSLNVIYEDNLECYTSDR